MFNNPFAGRDPDREQIWEMLVSRDIEAFVAADWSMVSEDFLEEAFLAIDARKSARVEDWIPGFTSADDYRDEWLRQARQAQADLDQDSIASALHALTDLEQIDINGDIALAHKHFDGTVKKKGGGYETVNWQTVYFCRRKNGRWKICGFLGYLPFPLLKSSPTDAVIQVTPATQHKTAGPYSPVLRITNPEELIVISGQAALDLDGNVIGQTIEEQTRVTLENCRIQLNNAGCDFSNVFKVNVYLTDLAEWPRFNVVYQEIMSEPFPARAAVQTGLLKNFKVEIEMWAAK